MEEEFGYIERKEVLITMQEWFWSGINSAYRFPRNYGETWLHKMILSLFYMIDTNTIGDKEKTAIKIFLEGWQQIYKKHQGVERDK